MQRCKDTAADGRGFIIAIDDDDLRQLISDIRYAEDDQKLSLLRDRFQQLT